MALKSMSTSEIRRELERREAGAGKLKSLHATLSRQMAALEAELADFGGPSAGSLGTGTGGTARRGRKPGRPKGSGKPGPRAGRKPGPKAGGRRGKHGLSLADAVAQVVAAGRTVSPADVLGSVKKVYKSGSKHLGMMVANALAKHPEFKRLGRGQYLRLGGKSSPSAAAPAAATSAGKPAKAGRKPGRGRKAKKARTAGRKPGSAGKAGKATASEPAKAASRKAPRKPGPKPGRKAGRKPGATARASAPAAKPAKPAKPTKSAKTSKPAKGKVKRSPLRKAAARASTPAAAAAPASKTVVSPVLAPATAAAVI